MGIKFITCARDLSKLEKIKNKQWGNVENIKNVNIIRLGTTSLGLLFNLISLLDFEASICSYSRLRTFKWATWFLCDFVKI